MSDTFVLKAEVREQTGSKHAAKVRNSGRIPAIVYGHQQAPTAISLDSRDFVKGLHHGQRLMDVQIGRKKQKILVKDVQYDYLGRDIIHVDLIRVDVAEIVTVRVPIELKGTAAGTHEGGIIEEHADHVGVECKVLDIPDTLVVSVKEVGVGDSLHASDIELPEGVKLASPAETLIVTCHLVAAAKTAEEVEEETPAGPEVIGEAEKVEGEEEKEGGEAGK